MDSHWFAPVWIDFYTWEANRWEQDMYSLKMWWAFEQWNLPEKVEKHLWLDKIGENQTSLPDSLICWGDTIAISHRILLYSHALWWHQINMKFSRALFDPEVHSASIPWFSIKKEKKKIGGGMREWGRKRKRKNWDNFLPPFSLDVTRWSICRSFVLTLTPCFSFGKKYIMPLLYLPNRSSLYVFVTDFP